MRLAVLSDIHGNLEAFQAVTADIQQRRLDEVVCLGDMIGYGPDPEEVVRGVMDLGFTSVLGNHEAALFNEKARDWMNFQARENNIRTAGLLSEQSLTYCRNLPCSLHRGEAWFVHGYPPSSVFAYIYNQSDRKIEDLFAAAGPSLYFVGHTHDLQLIWLQERVVRRPLIEGGKILARDRKYIINAGSVGQPRDGDKRAKYLIWDSETRELETLFIPYDSSRTIRKIRERGFPEAYALRLR